jgi:hypothetical protein
VVDISLPVTDTANSQSLPS